ncbi:MAG: Enoyl-CoA hydratase/isomerase [Proteobacteria bacterium]|nr:Enoyl-CoA hydratase/isomerase [Pseudomonadota bacterium]
MTFKEFGLAWRWDVDLYIELLAVAGGKERLAHYCRCVDPARLAQPDGMAFIARLHERKTLVFERRVEMGEVPARPGLSRLIGEGAARELAFTGRNFLADEGERLGLINRVFASHEALTATVRELAQSIAAKSPLATRCIKEVMNFSRDHSISDGLNFVATWNAAMLLSDDLSEAIAAQREKRAPRFAD